MNNKRKGKKQYYAKQQKKFKQDDQNGAVINLTENLNGFLITCNNNEFRCLKEAYNILNDTAERIYGTYSNGEASESNVNDVDIEASIKAELDGLKSSKVRRFIQAKTKCNNILFIRSNDENIEPDRMVRSIFDYVKNSGESNCRFIQRFIPVCGTFKAIESDKFVPQFSELFSKFASKEDQTFSVIAKVRNNSTFNSQTKLKETVILTILKERPNWKVDHNKPKIMVLVNIVQRAGCISILENFIELSKYNLVEYGEAVKKLEKPINENASDVKAPSDTQIEIKNEPDIMKTIPNQLSSET